MRSTSTTIKLSLIISFAVWLVIFWRTPSSDSGLPNASYDLNKLTNQSIQGAEPRWTDVTLQSGIDDWHIQRSPNVNGLHESLGSGTCAFDYDQDGWMDILHLIGSGQTHFFGKRSWWRMDAGSLRLYHNNGNGTFTDRTTVAGLETDAWLMACSVADFNNDGWTDIYLSARGVNELWQNNGDGKFARVIQHTSLESDEWSTGVAVADVDRNGFLDIYVTNYLDYDPNRRTFESHSGYKSEIPATFRPVLYPGVPNRLWLNRGDLRFEDKAEQYGVDNPQGRGLSADWIDANQDDYPDLIVNNDQGSENKLYLNLEGRSFVDKSVSYSLAINERVADSVPIDFALDDTSYLFTTTDQKTLPLFFERQESDRYRDQSSSLGARRALSLNNSHWGGVVSDFNADGWPDLFIANGLVTPDELAPQMTTGQSNTLLMNNLGGRFDNFSATLRARVYSHQSSRCAVALDFDNNGSTDLVISQNNDLGQVLRNELIPDYWIGIQLRNHNFITHGTKIQLTYPSTRGMTTIDETVKTTSDFLCSNTRRVRLALNDIDIDQTNKLILSVFWTNGEESIISGLRLNRYHLVEYTDEGVSHRLAPQKQQTNMVVQDPVHRLELLNWLVDYGQSQLANNTLIDYIEKESNPDRLAAVVKLVDRLESTDQVAVIQALLNKNVLAINLKLLRQIQKLEDERLGRWLLKLLDSDDPELICHTARVYGYFFDEEEAFIVSKYLAVTRLMRVISARIGNELSASDKEIVLCATTALGRSENYRAVGSLHALLNHPDVDIRKEAILSLGSLNHSSSQPALREILFDVEEHAPARAGALIALKRIRADHDIRPIVAELMSGANDKNANQAVIDWAYYRDELGIYLQSDLVEYVSPKASLAHEDNRSVSRTNTKESERCPNGKNKIGKQNTIEINVLLECNRLVETLEFNSRLIDNLLNQVDWQNLEHRRLLNKLVGFNRPWSYLIVIRLLNLSDYSIEDKWMRRILRQADQPYPRWFVENIRTRFREDRALNPELARILIGAGDEDVAQLAIERFEQHLSDPENEQLMLWARALVAIKPDSVLSKLVVHP